MGTDFYRNARINIDGIRFQSDLDGKILFLIHSSMSMMSMTKKHANLLDFTSFMNQAELTFYRQFRLFIFIFFFGAIPLIRTSVHSAVYGSSFAYISGLEIPSTIA